MFNVFFIWIAIVSIYFPICYTNMFLFFICKFNLLGAPYAKKSNVKQGKSITNYAPTHD